MNELAAAKESVTRVGIVGGGRGGLGMLNILADLPEVEIVFVLDRTNEPVGMQEARQRKIVTLTDMNEIMRHSPHLVIEATGVDTVYDELQEKLKGRATVVPSNVALFLFRCFRSGNARIQTEMTAIQTELTEDTARVGNVVTAVQGAGTGAEDTGNQRRYRSRPLRRLRPRLRRCGGADQRIGRQLQPELSHGRGDQQLRCHDGSLSAGLHQATLKGRRFRAALKHVSFSRSLFSQYHCETFSSRMRNSVKQSQR